MKKLATLALGTFLSLNGCIKSDWRTHVGRTELNGFTYDIQVRETGTIIDKTYTTPNGDPSWRNRYVLNGNQIRAVEPTRNGRTLLYQGKTPQGKEILQEGQKEIDYLRTKLR